MKNPISGRESTLLALLAQSKSLSKAAQKRIMASLSSASRGIAEAMLKIGNPNEFSKKAAKGFLDWAKSLPKRK